MKMICSKCNKNIEIALKQYNINIKHNSIFICKNCKSHAPFVRCELPLDEIKKLWFDGDGGKSICNKLKLKCHYITINRLARRYNWKRVSNEHKACNLIKQKDEEILRLFDSGIQASEISRILNLNYINLVRFLKRNGRKVYILRNKFNKRLEIGKQRSEILKKLWEEGRLNCDHLKDPKNMAKSVAGTIKKWEDPDYRNKMSEVSRLRWYRNRTWEKMKKFKDTKPELATKQILDLLNIKYERNFSVGSGFTVDFYLPEFNILLDIDGEYWHGRFNHEHKQVDYVVKKDNRKNEFIFSLSQYKYYRLWELTTLSREALLTIISRLLNKNVSIIKFNLKSLIFKEINFEDAKMFIEKFHYSGHIGQAIKTFGALFNNEIMGVGVFKYPTYNTNVGRIELSRFCIHPSYQMKNTASFMLSRFVNMIEANEIITYADTTQCHNGTIYKASNFKQDSITDDSYYYVDEYNSRYHKKVIYNHARCMKMSEADYVEKTGLRKVIEKPKIKFILQKNKI